MKKSDYELIGKGKLTQVFSSYMKKCRLCYQEYHGCINKIQVTLIFYKF